MFDARAPLDDPLDYSNPTVTHHTHTHRWPSLGAWGLRRRSSSDESFVRHTQPQERRRWEFVEETGHAARGMTDWRCDATQGVFEIAKIHLPHGGNIHTRTRGLTLHKICEKWRFSAVFTTFGIWWVHLKEGDWVRVCPCTWQCLCAHGYL